MTDNGNAGFVGVVGTMTSISLAHVNAGLCTLTALATLVYVGYGVSNRHVKRRLLKAEEKRLKDQTLREEYSFDDD